MRSAFISMPFLVCAALGVVVLVALPSIDKIGKIVMSISLMAKEIRGGHKRDYWQT